MKNNLLQRILSPIGRNRFMGAGTFSGFPQKNLKKLLSIVRFDYMGAAEFELGTISKCFKAIFEDEKYSFHQRNIKGITFYIITPDNSIHEYTNLIEKWSAENYYVEYHGLNDVIKGKNTSQIQGWLDIRDNVLFFINEDMAQKMKKFLNIN